ncbi:MAG: sterol desaturase family protein [Oligoflexia bacterium]|nr:sterol desaturase family protein [Oligoflexia bacterium]
MVEYLNRIFTLFVDPSQRIYWPFLLTSVIVLYLYTGNKGIKNFFHPSSILDYKLLVFNSLLRVFLFPLIFFSSFEVSVSFIKIFNLMAPNFYGLKMSTFSKSLFVTFFAFIIGDFLRFLQHYLMHRVSILRRFHSVHHSAEVLTPFTLFRTHPIESFISFSRGILSLSLTISFYSFLFKGAVSGIDILGVNIFGFIFNAALSNLRHSDLRISFGLLEYIFISPRMHQIHHSNDPKLMNKNFGVALSFWDQIVGSFYRPSEKVCRELVYGLPGKLSKV